MTLGKTAPTLLWYSAPHIDVDRWVQVCVAWGSLKTGRAAGGTRGSPSKKLMDAELQAGGYAVGDFARFTRLSDAQVVSFQEMTCRRLIVGC